MKYLTFSILFSVNLVFGQINIQWPKNSFSDFKHKPDSIYESWNDFNTDVFEIQKESYSKGLLEFSIDSLTTKDSIVFTPYITYGKPYSWNSINLIHTGIKVPTTVIRNWKNKLGGAGGLPPYLFLLLLLGIPFFLLPLSHYYPPFLPSFREASIH